MTIQLTRAQLEAAREGVAKNGIILTGDTGTVSHEGVILTFVYVEPTLTVTVSHKPWELSESFVEGKITGWFAPYQQEQV